MLDSLDKTEQSLWKMTKMVLCFPNPSPNLLTLREIYFLVCEKPGKISLSKTIKRYPYRRRKRFTVALVLPAHNRAWHDNEICMTVWYQEAGKSGSLLDENFGFRKTKHDAAADPTLIARDKRNFDKTRLHGTGFPIAAKAFDAVWTTFSSII